MIMVITTLLFYVLVRERWNWSLPDALMSRNAQTAMAFFKLPPERVVEVGVQVEL